MKDGKEGEGWHMGLDGWAYAYQDGDDCGHVDHGGVEEPEGVLRTGPRAPE